MPNFPGVEMYNMFMIKGIVRNQWFINLINNRPHKWYTHEIYQNPPQKNAKLLFRKNIDDSYLQSSFLHTIHRCYKGAKLKLKIAYPSVFPKTRTFLFYIQHSWLLLHAVCILTPYHICLEASNRKYFEQFY